MKYVYESCGLFKVPVKAIQQKNSKHIINVTNVLLKHITKTVN